MHSRSSSESQQQCVAVSSVCIRSQASKDGRLAGAAQDLRWRRANHMRVDAMGRTVDDPCGSLRRTQLGRTIFKTAILSLHTSSS